jgi:ubiquinone/menaquinone biosynthesis C-methylase UbiE
MIAPFDPYPHELPSTYIVFDRPSTEELTRLTIQDHSITKSMGGLLPEQPDPAALHDVLDIGSGSGDWVIQMAQAYPTMSLVGVDISKQMVTHGNKQAEQQHVTDRVVFRIMDALQRLDFPDASFDLTNMRLASSFVRTWEWRRVVPEMVRVTRPGGTIRISDIVDFGTCNSPALMQFSQWVEKAMVNASYYDKKTTIIEQLITLLTQFHCTQIQTRFIDMAYQAGTPDWQDFYDYVRYSFRTLRPFLRHRGCAPKEYDDVCQQALKEMKLPDFHATWRLQTLWCNLPEES